MQFAALGHPTTMGALAAGACFAFEWEAQALIGIKIVDDFAAHPIASCAVIWPGLPVCAGRPGFLDESIAPSAGVFALNDIMVVPTSDPGLWRLGGDIAAEAGMVVHARDRLLLAVAARRHDRVAFIDLAAGRTALLPDNLPLLYVGGWRLMHKALDGYETICRWSTPLSAQHEP